MMANETSPSGRADEAIPEPLAETAIKRVFLRLRCQGSDLDAQDISNKFLTQAGLPLLENFFTPHYMHEQPQEETGIYHIVLDVNPATAPADVKIQDIPHE